MQKKFDIYNDLLVKRGFDYNKYKCWVSEEETCMTVPIYSFDERMVGYQKYSPLKDKSYRYEGRYHTWSSEQGLWGLETIPEDYNGVVYLTEAVFRSVSLHRIGKQSVSLLGCTCSKRLLREMRNHPNYKFVWIGDPPSNGVDAGKIMVNKIGGFQSPKDLDEMTDEEIIKMFEEQNVRL